MIRAKSLILLGAVLFCAVSAHAEPFPITITTLPFDNAEEQRAIFALLGNELSKGLGRPVNFVASKTYDDAIQMLATGKADVAILGAAAYVKARRQGHVRAILRTVRHKRTTYFGQVVVKKGSPIKTIADLKGKKVAFVDRSSTGGYLYPRMLFVAAGLNPETDIEPVFAGGHHLVAQMVAKGEVAAGACFEGAEDTLSDPTAITAIARTEPVPGDPVVVRPGLGSELIKNLRSAMIELATVPGAQAYFKFSEVDGYVPAVDGDYDRVDELMRQLK